MDDQQFAPFDRPSDEIAPPLGRASEGRTKVAPAIIWSESVASEARIGFSQGPKVVSDRVALTILSRSDSSIVTTI